MIFCPDGIISDSGLTGLNNIYIYICIYIEQVQAVTPLKAPTIRPPASHHENHPS